MAVGLCDGLAAPRRGLGRARRVNRSTLGLELEDAPDALEVDPGGR